MEILIIAVVIIVLALIMGVSVELITAVVLSIAGLLTLLMLVFFIYSFARLLRTKGCEGTVAGLREHERYKYPWAWYRVGEKEYRNVFPSEVILRDRLYPVGKLCRLRINEKQGVVYDRNALLCIVIGLALSAILLVTVADQLTGVLQLIIVN